MGNQSAVQWLKDKLLALRDIIGGALSASTSTLTDDVAIVPTEKAHFSFLQNMYVVDLLRKLGFLAPSRYMGTCFWRIPREFKTTDIGDMAEWMEEALALPIDADLKALGLAAQRDRVAMPGDEENEAMAARLPQSNLAEEAEEDESEEEYQPRERGQRMEEESDGDEDGDGDNDEAERKRKKKE